MLGQIDPNFIYKPIPTGIKIYDWPEIDQKQDLEAVAGIMMNLDLVLSAATAVGELAGALGRKTYRFTGSPDWTMLGETQRLWYADMHSFECLSESDWSDTIKKAHNAVKEFLISGVHF